jgi:hypothetical protein
MRLNHKHPLRYNKSHFILSKDQQFPQVPNNWRFLSCQLKDVADQFIEIVNEQAQQAGTMSLGLNADESNRKVNHQMSNLQSWCRLELWQMLRHIQIWTSTRRVKTE